jgi:hypothetical protein
MRHLLVAFVALVGLCACTAMPNETRSATSAISRPSAPTSTITPRPTIPPTAAGRPAALLLTRTGIGAKTVLTKVPAHVRSVTVRFTCIGRGPTQLRSTKGGLVLGTLGCMEGVIYSSYFEPSPHRDPRSIRIKVEPDVRWAIEVWAGKYVQQVSGKTDPTA